MSKTAKSKDGKEEVELDKWIVNESTGEKVMYSRLQTIPICKGHKFDRQHRCTKCPYMFTGFIAHKHIQRDDGIYERQTGKKII